jgi:hypothetical protein
METLEIHRELEGRDAVLFGSSQASAMGLRTNPQADLEIDTPKGPAVRA